MIRILAAMLFLTAAAAAAAQTPAGATGGPVLRSDVMVTSDIVRIGDLVENAGGAASIAVFRAPDLGQTGSVPAARVLDVLRPHGVIAVDTRGASEVTVTRASRAIGTQEIEKRIAQTIAARYGLRDPDNLSVTFDREFRTLHVDPHAPAEFAVSRLAFDPRSGRFDIVFEIGSRENAPRLPMRFTGSLLETEQAAVLVRPIARGDVLRESDFAVERRPKREVTSDTVREPQAAIGMAARHPLKAGQTVRRGDLTRPELVQRNEPVIIMFEQPGLVLSLRGKALDSGAEGDTVNVVNLQSKRTLQGIVTGPGRVAVVSLTPRATTNIAAVSHPAAPVGR